jgi:SAM-dependent methyltransferase
MSSLSAHDPTGRFTGLADIYAKCRPDYPPPAVDYILAVSRLGPASLLVDVGCGTGISSRQFAARGVAVLGIEPNDDMRSQAERAEWSGNLAAPRYQAGRAEDTGLPDASAGLVLAAQAFHWFEPEAALREFHRILQPGGWVALMWNERDETDPATAAYGAVIRTGPRAEVVEGGRRRAGEALLDCPLFANRHRIVFSHIQILDEDGLVNRALSASYAPREGEARERFTAELRQVAARHQQHGQIRLRYQSTVYLGQK